MEILNQIIHYFLNLFSTEGFPPRWVCGTGWDAFTGWLYIFSDIAIWSAYYTIPLVLVYFVRHRKDVPFQRVFLLFAAFILACGSTHLFDALMFWWPAYRLSGLVYLWTGIISWVTVFALIPILPQALSLRSPIELQREIDERIKAEQALRESEEEQRISAEQLREYSAHLETINKELESFSYSVSHDLRAPLRGINSFTSILLEEESGNLSEQGKKYFQYIMDNSRKMSELIEALLNLSRLSRSDMAIETLNLSAMVQAIANQLQAELPQRHVEFQIAENIMAKGDPHLLRIALENLVENAWKFTEHQNRTIIEFNVLEQDGNRVYYIRDNGAGFDMRYVNKLFGPFQRLHTEQEFPGTGIGLATVQRIIQRHNGSIWANGGIAEGATFYFTLDPVEQAPKPIQETLLKQEPACLEQLPARKAGPGNAILIVEDNPFDEALMLKALRQFELNKRVIIARDGEEGLDYIFKKGKYFNRSVREDPAFIILDLKIPKVSGIEVLKQIRSHEETRDIPVIIVSSSNVAEDIASSYEAGADKFLHKHPDFNTFVKTLKTIEPWLAEI